MDRDLLEYKMKASGTTRINMQEYLGLSTSGFYKKMSGVTQFTRIEIKKIIEYLNLNREDVINIFFKDIVSFKDTIKI